MTGRNASETSDRRVPSVTVESAEDTSKPGEPKKEQANLLREKKSSESQKRSDAPSEPVHTGEAPRNFNPLTEQGRSGAPRGDEAGPPSREQPKPTLLGLALSERMEEVRLDRGEGKPESPEASAKRSESPQRSEAGSFRSNQSRERRQRFNLEVPHGIQPSPSRGSTLQPSDFIPKSGQERSPLGHRRTGSQYSGDSNTSFVSREVTTGSEETKEAATGSKETRKAATGSKETRKAATGSKETRKAATGSEGTQKTSTESEGIQEAATGSKETRKAATGSEGIQKTSTESEGIQKTSTESEGIQEAPTGREDIQKTSTESEDKGEPSTSRGGKGKGREVRPVIDSIARDMAAKQREDYELRLLEKWRDLKTSNMRPGKGGLRGQQEIIDDFKERYGMSEKKVEDKISEKVRTEFVKILNESVERLGALAEKQGNTIKEIYNNDSVPSELLGRNVIQESSTVVEALDDLIRKQSASSDLTNDRGSESLRNLNDLRNHIDRCGQVGKENFSNIVGMKRTVQDDRERLESFFMKFRFAATTMEEYGRNIGKGLDLLTSAHHDVTSSLASWSLGEMTVFGRVKDGELPLPKFANYVPQIEEFYNHLSQEPGDRPPSPRLKSLPPRPTELLKEHITTDEPSDAVRRNPRAGQVLLSKIDSLRPSEDKLPFSRAERQHITIKSGLEQYESSLVESAIEKVTKGPYGDYGPMQGYLKAYDQVLKDIGQIFSKVNENETFEGPLNEGLLSTYKSHLENYIQKSQELTANIVKEVNSQKAACTSAFNLANDVAQINNIDVFRRRLLSFGNIAQKIGTIGLGGAVGHGASGFPNA